MWRRSASKLGRYRQAARVAALLVATISAPASAWGDYGHRTIAAIATRFLTPAASAAVAELIASEPLLATPLCPVATLGDASVWADCVRGRYKERYSLMSGWHYVNVNICTAFALPPCQDGNCITAALPRQLAVLSDLRASRPARVAALNWVVHLVGDLHQPLHVSDNNDRGGNDVVVTLPGVQSRYPLNLHRVWDTELAERAIEAGQHGAIWPVRGEVEDDAAGSIDQWARQSWTLARTAVYGPLPGARGCSIPGSVELDESYIRRSTPVIQQQVRVAGVRLAKVLNQALR